MYVPAGAQLEARRRRACLLNFSFGFSWASPCLPGLMAPDATRRRRRILSGSHPSESLLPLLQITIYRLTFFFFFVIFQELTIVLYIYLSILNS